jgi:hypothetical protein
MASGKYRDRCREAGKSEDGRFDHDGRAGMLFFGPALKLIFESIINLHRLVDLKSLYIY